MPGVVGRWQWMPAVIIVGMFARATFDVCAGDRAQPYPLAVCCHADNSNTTDPMSYNSRCIPCTHGHYASSVTDTGT